MTDRLLDLANQVRTRQYLTDNDFSLQDTADTYATYIETTDSWSIKHSEQSLKPFHPRLQLFQRLFHIFLVLLERIVYPNFRHCVGDTSLVCSGYPCLPSPIRSPTVWSSSPTFEELSVYLFHFDTGTVALSLNTLNTCSLHCTSACLELFQVSQ